MLLIRSLGLLGLISAIVVLSAAQSAHAANHPATAADCAKLATLAPGIPCVPGTTPYDPSNSYIGDEAAVATQFLIAHMGNGSRGAQCYTSPTDRITKLNPQFKIGLYKALSAMEQQLGGKNIIQSGFRCDGTGGNHPRGCAVDIIWASCSQKYPGDTWKAWRCSSDYFDAPEQKWIDANGKNAPYNIHLRLRYAPEGHHVEPVNTSGCVTGALVTSGGNSPSSGITDAIRQALTPLTAMPQQPALPSQPLSTAQSVTDAFNTPTPTVTPTTGTGGATTGGVSDQISGGANTGTSSADILEQLAFGGKATSTQGATSTFTVVVNGQDVGGIASTQHPSSQSGTSTINGGSPIQNTFVTNDFSFESSNSGSQNPFIQILESIRQTLLAMLKYLKPFGSRVGHDPEYDF